MQLGLLPVSKRSVWVTYGRTEDNDDLQPLVWWGGKPDDKEINEVYAKLRYGTGMIHKTVKASVQ